MSSKFDSATKIKQNNNVKHKSKSTTSVKLGEISQSVEQDLKQDGLQQNIASKGSVGDSSMRENVSNQIVFEGDASTSGSISEYGLGETENKRPILRVNLFKKPTRPINPLTALGRRNLEARQRLAAKPITRVISNQSVQPTVQQQQQQSVEIEQSIPKKIENSEKSSGATKNNKNINNQKCNSSGSKPGDMRNKVSIKERPDSGRSNRSTNCAASIKQDEAKKSQKLVVSMIRDISKTISKEDLDELLHDINTIIDEVKQNQLGIKGKANVVSKKASDQNDGDLSRGNRRTSERRKDQAVRTTTTSKLGNTTTKLEEADSELFDQGINAEESDQELKVKSANLRAIDSPNEDSSSEIRRQCRQFVIDLSSDEETVRGSTRRLTSCRLPDRCLRVTSSHAKYISPHRKRSLEDRLNRAQEAREKFLEYRANKFREILKKVEEMRAWKEEDTVNLRTSVQTKLQKAAEKRKEQLDKIIRKAHDEDSKVSEIQFINNLEAQNRRHDINSRKKEFEARLQDLQDERQRKFEEKQAKEIAAEERRKTLEAERKAKLLEIQEKRKLKDKKVEQQQQVKEKRRIEKNRDRDQKISAIKEAFNVGVQTLKKRINQKQEQSERRHEVNLRLIRQKAFELSIKRYNSFICESRGKIPNNLLDHHHNHSKNSNRQANNNKNKDTTSSVDPNDSQSKRLQLKPFNTKKFCNLCKETIGSELALFSHLRSENHHNSINQHYGDAMLTTNEVVEIHNLRHIVDTDEPLDSDKGAISDDQQSSRASSLVNYYHSSYLSQANGGIMMTEGDRASLLAIERKCRKLRQKLIVAGKPFSREWFTNKIRSRLAQLLIQQRSARNQTTNTDASSLANTIDLSANNSLCQQNKPIYLKINRITRELISVATDQRISGGGLMPAGIIHSVDRLLADINKQLNTRKVPQLSPQLLHINYMTDTMVADGSGTEKYAPKKLDAEQLAMATKMIEFYAIDTLYLYDIVVCLVSILKRIVPNVSLTSKLPSTVASHYSTLIDPISLNSYYCHRSPILPTRVYIKMIGMLQSLCSQHADLCYIVFHSNNIIYLSDILSYRLGFIIGNESPASSISGSSSAATLSAHTIDRVKVTNQSLPIGSSGSKPPPKRKSSIGSDDEEDEDDGGGGSVIPTKRDGVNYHIQHRRGQQIDDDDDDDDNEDDELMWNRAETYKRTEDIVDDMTADLCKLLATITDTILSRPLILLNNLDRSAFGQRSDDFISYMVSVGIVDTESVIMSHIHQQQNLHDNSSPSSNSCSTINGHQLSLLSSSSAISAAAPPLANPSNSSVCDLNSQHHQTLGGSNATATNSNSNLIQLQQSATNLQVVFPTASSRIINFTTSCVQFVTSLVKLVIAKLPEDEQLASSATGTGSILSSTGSTTTTKTDDLIRLDPTQLLATLKLTQLSGVLTLVYDLLVQSFNSLAADWTTSKQQSDSVGTVAQLSLVLASLRLINYVAYIDVQLVQSTLAADEMLPLQLRHVCSYLINFLVQSPQFKPTEPIGLAFKQTFANQANATTNPEVKAKDQVAGDELKSELLAEIILLLGYFAHLNHDNQLMLKSGRQPTIIEQLVNLPFDYFSRARLKAVLIPTLISCSYSNEQICTLVCQELNLSMLTSFIEDQLLGAQVENKQQQSSHLSLLTNELTNTKLVSNRWRCERRFAKSKWLSAKKFFENLQTKARLSAKME